MLIQVLFHLFAAILILAALGVITARNPVYSALALVMCFITSAAIWLLIEAEFLAVVLVLVYVGAVMVLFLFVVMMLDINIDRSRGGFWRHFPVAAIVAAAISLQLWLVLANGNWLLMRQPGPGILKANNTQALGTLAFTEYVFPLQLAGVILLVAIVAAIALTLRRRKDAKHQSPSQQVRVRSSDRVSLVKMPAEGRAQAQGGAEAAKQG
jgi:NADH-quinone oxidoreductase subunit J